MTQPVGSPVTPATVGGTMAKQDFDSVFITGGSMSNTSLLLRVFPTSSLLGGSHTAGQLVYCSDGDSGSPCLAVYDGSSFKRISLGATVST